LILIQKAENKAIHSRPKVGRYPHESAMNRQPYLQNKIFISADFETKKFTQKSAKIFYLKISQNENFIMQMAYGDKKLFYNFF
jgi:hypothetical protein